MHKQNSALTAANTGPIAVFDSGLGGVSTLGLAMHLLPEEDFLYFGDSGVPPYAFMSTSQIRDHCFSICDRFAAQDAKAIVIACNTATSAALEVLKQRYPIPIVGIAPAIAAAVVLGGNGKILVLATEFMVRSKTLHQLIERHGSGRRIEALACRALIDKVESGTIAGPSMDGCIRDFFAGTDVDGLTAVVLGCTHLGFIAKTIGAALGPDIHIVDGNHETVAELMRVMDDQNLCRAPTGRKGDLVLANSGGEPYINNARAMLNAHLAQLQKGT